MKTLQNNFTTPEQSKRLLELGVSKNSADHYYGKGGKLRYIDGTIPYSLLWEIGCTPCWSVGRLIEICKVCSNVPIDWTGGLNEEREILEVVYSTLFALYLGKHMDFSKLEE